MERRTESGHPERWEERLRYDVLRAAYDRAGADCARSVSAAEIGAGLDVRHEDLFRIVYVLDSRHYLRCVGPGPRVCITERGIRYIEEEAGRRRTLRLARAA